jgi:hypothetical protein
MPVRSLLLATALLWACTSPADDGPQDAAPRFQGPINPGFEAEGTTPQQPGVWAITGAYLGGACPSFGGGPTPIRVTGTSFMPTDGTYYLAMQPDGAMTMTIEQDGIYLDAATELLFDYEISGQLGAETTAGDVTIELLFTSQGTTTLWSREYLHQEGTTMPIPPTSQRDERVTFSPFPEPGRLMLRLTQTCNGTPSSTSVAFAIDNIRAL